MVGLLSRIATDMVALVNRIAIRMVALAAITTAITMLVGLTAYRAASDYRLATAVHRMPPRARAEFDRLVRDGQRGGDRYHDLLERFDGDGLRVADLGLVAGIGIVSIVAGGGVAVVLARRISRPITAVARAAAAVSAGDRSARVRQAHRGETGELIDSFNRMAADIDAYHRERTVLTAGIAHELRTPLTILKGRLHALADGVIDPATGEADRLLRQVEQLSRLVEDLRTLAHADIGGIAIERRRLDLGELLHGVVADFRTSAASRDVALVETCTPAAMLGDPVRLTQLFANLLTNAIKHAPDGSRVDVALFTARGHAVVSVIDEGEGFVPDDEGRLFAPFWRGSADKRLGRPGTGIGLTLAAKMAEAHGGRIVAKNRADRSGAVFAVWLPLPGDGP